MSEQNKMEELKRLLDNVADRIEQEFSDYDTVGGPSLIYPMRISDMPDNITNACWKAEHNSYYNVNNDIETIADENSLDVTISKEIFNQKEVYDNIKELLNASNIAFDTVIKEICEEEY